MFKEPPNIYFRSYRKLMAVRYIFNLLEDAFLEFSSNEQTSLERSASIISGSMQ